MPKKGPLQTFLHAPQRLRLRRLCFQIHLWAGLLLSLYVVAIGISGSVLVFKDELMPRPHFSGRAPDPAACTPAQLLTAMQVAARTVPSQQPVLASCPTVGNPFFALRMKPTSSAAASGKPQPTTYVDLRTGQVAGAVDQDASWVGTLDRFHTELFLGESGRRWNGAGAAALLLLVGTGLVIWWPGLPRWRRAFTVSLRSNWKRLNWDLHSAIGIWTVAFTMVWAVTGIYFAWETPIESVIAAISPITTAQYPATQLEHLTRRPLASPDASLDLNRVLQEAARRSPNAHLEGLFFGTGPKAVLTIYMARGQVGDYARTDFLYFDQHTGDLLLAWRRGQNHTLGDWLLWMLVPLHFGTSFGQLGKLLWALVGLALPALTVTAWLMYWQRYLRRWLGKF